MDIASLILRSQDTTPKLTPVRQGPPNRFPQIWGFIGTFLSLATIAVVLRLVSRIKFSHIGADDILIIIAYVLNVGGIAATVLATKYGLAIHTWDVDYSRTGISLQKCSFASQVMYPASLGFIKLSILFFLVRVIPSSSRWRKRICAIAAFVLSQEAAFTIVLSLQCWPPSYYWDKEMNRPGTCINQTVFYYLDASINICTDLMILSLPWFIFSRLQIPRRKKYALLAICSAGCLCVLSLFWSDEWAMGGILTGHSTLVTSIVRLPFLQDLNQSKDPSWSAVDVTTWSIAEISSAITAASVPCIRPLVTWIFPRFTFSSGGTSNPTFDARPSKGGPLVLSVIGGDKTDELGPKSYTEIERRRDNESEEYILNEDGRVIRQTITTTTSSETLREDNLV